MIKIAPFVRFHCLNYMQFSSPWCFTILKHAFWLLCKGQKSSTEAMHYGLFPPEFAPFHPTIEVEKTLNDIESWGLKCHGKFWWSRSFYVLQFSPSKEFKGAKSPLGVEKFVALGYEVFFLLLKAELKKLVLCFLQYMQREHQNIWSAQLRRRTIMLWCKIGFLLVSILPMHNALNYCRRTWLWRVGMGGTYGTLHSPRSQSCASTSIHTSIHPDVHSLILILLFVCCAWIVPLEQMKDFLPVFDLYWHLYMSLCMQINLVNALMCLCICPAVFLWVFQAFW